MISNIYLNFWFYNDCIYSSRTYLLWKSERIKHRAQIYGPTKDIAISDTKDTNEEKLEERNPD